MNTSIAPMISITTHAQESPDRLAIVMGGGHASLTYAELDTRSLKLAHYLQANGLHRGDHIAILMDNCLNYLVVCMAAQRSGLYFTPVNRHLSAEEMAYVVDNCGAKALIISPSQTVTVEARIKDMPSVSLKLVDGPAANGFVTLQSIFEVDVAADDIDQCEGQIMFYSSGTTGRPKGVKRPMSGAPWGTVGMMEGVIMKVYHIDGLSVQLCPAPLYHAAPMTWAMATLRKGGLVVIMEKFDALDALRLTEKYKVTHAQYVPTMFVRMLNLPNEDRQRFDLSSLRVAAHAGAPCAVDIKQRMLEWFGPVIYEYYGGTEGNGLCAVTPSEWTARPGTVGKPLAGHVHILDEAHQEMPPGEIGMVYFGGMPPFEYHMDPEKTRAAFTSEGWSTLGDYGYVDNEGYVFLADRRTDLIISGGVNVYPRETEEALQQHGAVLDVAVVGVLSAEFGEDVLAVVQLKEGHRPSPQLADELIAFSRSKIAHFKCPKRIEFSLLPRTPTGKLQRYKLKQHYKTQTASGQ